MWQTFKSTSTIAKATIPDANIYVCNFFYYFILTGKSNENGKYGVTIGLFCFQTDVRIVMSNKGYFNKYSHR